MASIASDDDVRQGRLTDLIGYADFSSTCDHRRTPAVVENGEWELIYLTISRWLDKGLVQY